MPRALCAWCYEREGDGAHLPEDMAVRKAVINRDGYRLPRPLCDRCRREWQAIQHSPRIKDPQARKHE